MLMQIIGGFAVCTLLVAFGSCGSISGMDYSNHTEAAETSSMRISRNSKLTDRCLTSDGYTGTCMSRFNCMRQGGAVSGFCGTYGVCCETNLLCGGLSRQKTIIIKSPVTLPMNTCPYVIEPYSTNVCQLHILMERFSLEQPIPDGDTLECGDHLAVSELKICGDNHNQHIYVPFNGIDHIQLEFFLPNRWASTIWRLILTQLECPAVKTKRTSLSVSNSLLPFLGQNGLSDIRNIFSTHNSDLDVLAPPGCLQYHTARDGIIESFNYRNFAGPYLAGMTYAICFKRLFQDSMIQFTTTNFQLSKQITSDDGFDEQCHSPVNTQNRKSDYLMIPQAMFAPLTDIQPTYFCGASIPPNQIICSATPGPFIVYFSSDRLYDVIENAERGFRFTYRIQ